MHARRSQPELALQCVQRALDSARSFGHTHHTYYQIACVYAVLRETHKAMEWLERSVHTGFSCWPFFRIDPNLENLREEPEFKRLVADLEHKYTARKDPEVIARVALFYDTGVVARRTVDRWNLASHRPNVGAQLAAVVDGIEKDVPKELTERSFSVQLVVDQKLGLALPGIFVKPFDAIDPTPQNVFGSWRE